MDAYWFITTSPTKMSWTFCTKIILTILNNSLNSLNISRWICLLGFFLSTSPSKMPSLHLTAMTIFSTEYIQMDMPTVFYLPSMPIT